MKKIAGYFGIGLLVLIIVSFVIIFLPGPMIADPISFKYKEVYFLTTTEKGNFLAYVPGNKLSVTSVTMSPGVEIPYLEVEKMREKTFFNRKGREYISWYGVLFVRDREQLESLLLR